MKRLIASVALTFGLIASTPVQAQDDHRQGAQRSVRTARPGIPSRWTGKPSQRLISSASHDEYVTEGEIVIDGDPIMEDVHPSGCDSCGGGGCDSCSVSDSFCGSCSAPHRFCICLPAHGWVSAEYLLWYSSGMRVPVLASTGDAVAGAGGAVGTSGFASLFGGDDILDEDRSGARVRFGSWLQRFPGWGIEGEYVGLSQETSDFFSRPGGTDPLLARPYFDVTTGSENSVVVSTPPNHTGSLDILVASDFDGGAFRVRHQLTSSQGCGYSELCCQTIPTSSRLDKTVGYRFWELDESITIDHTSVVADNAFAVRDLFSTRNQFNGAELGFLWQARRGWWSIDTLMRLGIGNVRQTVTIEGTTVITPPGGAAVTNLGGILALPAANGGNIGSYEQDKFTMVPELGVTLGYQMTKRVRLTAGYSLVYFGNVVRPGDQIDRALNPNLFPSLAANPTVTVPNRPQFNFVETDYWVQGLSFGGEFRW